ncbi:hypothetical protein Nepgr_005732 [Nepenthes gracilis]|uniref:HTH OST-type domain-containing protein n=1 Tax=Nepenthes gracilis TaxID=150966 RepID=A0AAD3S3Q8_NEPGR|nr:hypothetical protein Nepgr_005732 [Nepenthes gracilis]
MISDPSTTHPLTSAECSEKSGMLVTNPNPNVDMAPSPSNQPSQTSSQGPVAILWDIENCPVPSDVRPEDVAGNIRMALRVHPVIKGVVTVFSAYGDFNSFSRRLREGCQRTGVKLIDVPNGRKDAADKAILVDMFLFALDNRPPSSVMLISGDVDFAPALHILGQRGYTVILVIPSGVGVSSALSNAGKFVWDWPSVARGEGFVPSTKPLMAPRGGLSDIAGYLIGCHISESADGNEEEAILYRGLSQGYYNSKDFSILSPSLSEFNGSSVNLPWYTTTVRSQSLPSGLNEALAGCATSNDPNEYTRWVQPGNINGLKGQLVKLLKRFGGCLQLARVPAEYQKFFGRPLFMQEYGAFKLVNLLKKMSDAMAIDGEGPKKFVYLRNSKAGGPSAPPLSILKKDKKGKGVQGESFNMNAGVGSSDEFSDDERVVTEEHNVRRAGDEYNLNAVARSATVNQELEHFKQELQDILVSYSCRILLSRFEEIYQQRYKKPLDYRRFGVDKLEELFDKVRDVAVLHEDPVDRKKFLVAVLIT